MKNIRVFLSETFQFLEVKFSKYLNRRVFVMWKRTFGNVHPVKIQISLRIRAVWLESLLGAFLINKDCSFLMRKTITLIRLRVCAGWFESSLGAHIRRYVFWHCGSYGLTQRWNNVESTLIQRQDVKSMLFQSCVPAGKLIHNLQKHILQQFSFFQW